MNSHNKFGLPKRRSASYLTDSLPPFDKNHSNDEDSIRIIKIHPWRWSLMIAKEFFFVFPVRESFQEISKDFLMGEYVKYLLIASKSYKLHNY